MPSQYFPTGTFPGQAVGGPSRQLGGAFDAVGDAVKLWLQLRQQGVTNQRELADQELRRQQLNQTGQYYQGLLANSAASTTYAEANRRRDDALEIANRYAGRVASPDTVAQFNKLGLQDALEPQMTLPSRRFALDVLGGAGAMGQPQFDNTRPTETVHPPSPTGAMKFAMPEDMRSRIAASNAAAALARAQYSQGQQNQRALLQHEDRLASLQQSRAIHDDAYRTAQAYLGLSREQFDKALVMATNQLTQQQFNAQLALLNAQRNNPAFILQMLQSGQTPQLPAVPSFTPPGTPQPTPSDFEIVR